MAVSDVAELESPVVSGRAGPPLLAIYAMALVSGAAALCYEICWARMLALTFGNSTFSASAVIAAFMGGMGLGAWLYHHLGRRFSQPLVAYAGLEFGIALSTAVITPLFYRLPDWFVVISRAGYGDGTLLAARFATVLALLVIPAALMGATFPALCRALIRSVRGFDRHMGMVYGINTVGAACGAVLAGIVLIERLGLTNTVRVANGMNLLVAISALVLARKLETAGDTPASSATTRIATDLPRWISGGVLLLSGYTTLSYEIFWFRGLRFIVGNSTYALTIVLVIFLLGLGIGSLGLRWSLRIGSAERALAAVQCAIGALAMVAVGVAWLLLKPGGLHDSISVFAGALGGMPWWGKLLVNAGVAAAVMLPATLMMGLSFPLASRLFLGDIRQLDVRVGLAYLLANVGSIAGSITAAVWLLPTWGALSATKGLALLNLAVGMLVVAWVYRRQRDGDALWIAFGAALSVVVLFFYLPDRFTLTGEAGVYENANVVRSVDGDLSTVQILENPARRNARAMAIDGSVIGVTQSFSPRLYLKQVLLAHLPMVLDTEITTVLQIGLGSATTLEALAKYERLESIECVEINQPVVELSEEYFGGEQSVFEDPRVEIHVDDALYFLLRTEQRYDAIISDGKQNFVFAGNATMLCHDFYQYARDRLTENGLFVQWIPQGMLAEEFRIVCRNFCDVFPQGAVYSYSDRALLFVGSKQPLAGRRRMGAAEYEARGIRQALEGYHLRNPESLLAHVTCDLAQLRAENGPGVLSTWDHNRIEFLDFKATAKDYQRSPSLNLILLLRAGQRPSEELPRLVAELDEGIYESCRLLRAAYVLAATGKQEEALDAVRSAMAADPKNGETREVLEFVRSMAASGPSGD